MGVYPDELHLGRVRDYVIEKLAQQLHDNVGWRGGGIPRDKADWYASESYIERHLMLIEDAIEIFMTRVVNEGFKKCLERQQLNLDLSQLVKESLPRIDEHLGRYVFEDGYQRLIMERKNLNELHGPILFH